jgi:glycerophosphoryl diester phosphodiesterase
VSAWSGGPVAVRAGGRREYLAVAIGLLLVALAAVPLFLVVRPEVARNRVQVLAHRGASAYAPENTLAAFRRAIEQRADWLEFDVQQTRDGQLVVFHDLRVERTTNGRGAVRDLTLDEVRRLDAGSWFGREFAGEPVPTFAEVVALARDAGIRIFPEVKDPRLYPGIEERVADVLRAYGFEDRTIVQSFDGDSLERLRGLNPRLRLAALYTSSDPIKGDPPARADVIGPQWELVASEPAIVRDAHAVGRQVVVWTVDAPSAGRQMIESRVDGIITNRPDIVRALLDGR